MIDIAALVVDSVVQVGNGDDVVLEHSLKEVMARQFACHVARVGVVQDRHSRVEAMSPLLEDRTEVLKFVQPALVDLLGGFLIMVDTSYRKQG